MEIPQGLGWMTQAVDGLSHRQNRWLTQRGPLSLKLVTVTSNEVCPGRQRSGPELPRLSKGSRNIQSQAGLVWNTGSHVGLVLATGC